MRYGILAMAATVILGVDVAAQDPTPPDMRTPAQRGALAVRGQPAMNPPLWSAKAYDNLWKRWGLAEKPVDLRNRCGTATDCTLPRMPTASCPWACTTRPARSVKGLSTIAFYVTRDESPARQ